MKRLVRVVGLLLGLAHQGAFAADLSDPLRIAEATDVAADRVVHTNGHIASPELGEMIGQMIMVGFVGNTAEHEWFKTVHRQIKDGAITGVIFLKRNIRDRTSVFNMTATLQLDAPNELPPLISVDQEGGRIERLTTAAGFPHTPSAAVVAKTMDPREAYETYLRLASNLNAWGFNLNLGPVVDLNQNPQNPIIGRLGRSFSANARKVQQYSAAFIQAHREQGVLTALKHFPGHGSSSSDSHKGFVDVSKSWSAEELTPFQYLIQDGYADVVMTAHVYNAQIQGDEKKVPVSLSRRAITGTLRAKLGFDGVIISDDMQMGAIAENYSLADAVLSAVRAGNDILIFANDKNPDIRIPEKVTKILLDAATNDESLRNRIRRSYTRIISLKRKIERMHVDTTSTRAIDGYRGNTRLVLYPDVMAQQKRTVPLVVNLATAQ